MVLKPQDFVVIKANWDAKNKNMESIAQELNLGLGSFVFVDDSRYECDLIRTTLPQVHVLDFPTQAEQVAALTLQLEELFNTGTNTEEDRQRTGMYAQRKARQELEATIANREEYLKNLGMKVLIHAGKENLEYLQTLIF